MLALIFYLTIAGMTFVIDSYRGEIASVVDAILFAILWPARLATRLIDVLESS